MTLYVSKKLVNAPLSPATRAAFDRLGGGFSLPIRVLLALRWLDAKSTRSKVSAAKRVGSVIGESPQMTASLAKAVLPILELSTYAECARQCRLSLSEGPSLADKGLASIVDTLRHSHDAGLFLFWTKKDVIPCAAYRSGGKFKGLGAHIYLFFPSIGETKGIKPVNFADVVNRSTWLAPGDEDAGIQAFLTKPLGNASAVNEPVYAELEEPIYAEVGEPAYMELYSTMQGIGFGLGGGSVERSPAYDKRPIYENSWLSAREPQTYDRLGRK